VKEREKEVKKVKKTEASKLTSIDKAKEAMTQINEKQYAGQFVTAKKVGIAIDDKLRQIKEWVVE